MPDTPASDSPRWTSRKTIAGVLLLCILVRLWSLGSLPLIVTNDGVGYLTWGERILRGQPWEIPELRTPGYPLFLAGVFHIFGLEPTGVMLAQHALACLTCACLTVVACRLAGPRWGALPGLLYTFDPWILVHENYALSEPLVIAMITVCAAIALCATRGRYATGLILGLLLGGACLVRPSVQTLVPFFVLAWLVRSFTSWRSAIACTLLAAIGLGVTLTPWLAYNARRGVRGLACGYSAVQWIGLANFRILDWTYPLPPDLHAQLADLEAGKVGLDQLPSLVRDIGGHDSQADLLTKWNRASIRAHPGRFLRLCEYTLCWQLNYFPSTGPATHDELTWYVWRAGQDGTNTQCGAPLENVGLAPFAMSGQGGPLRQALLWWAANRIQGIPQIPVFVAALLVTLLALIRRDWPLILVYFGTLAFLASHIITLLPVSRYTMPMIVLWYLAPVILIAQVWSLARGRTRASRLPAGAPAETIGPEHP